MSVFEEVKRLGRREYAILVVTFLGTVAPGFLIIGIYYPPLLRDLDVLKLTLLSCGLTLPINLMNIGAVTLVTEKKVEEDLLSEYVMGFMLSSIVLYVPLLITLFRQLSVRSFAWS